MDTTATTLARMPSPTRHMLLHQHPITALLLNTGIALLIWLLGHNSLLATWIYSQCIGLGIWGSIDMLRYRFMSDEPGQWPRLMWLVPLGVFMGYALGTSLGNLILGQNNMAYWSGDVRRSLGFFLFSLAVGALCSYEAFNRAQRAQERERAAQAQAQAQAALRQSAQAQLQLLQSQLEPHMLFNTLANLRALMGLDVVRAQTMLDHLVAYLRATLDASRSTEHALEQEFDRLRDYLELMQVRMGARLRYQLDLPPELAQHRVPPLLLQSLVENSIQHGLEPQVAGGTVHISASRRNDRLHLVVQDDGVGSTTDLNHPPPGTQRFGVAQVRERLQTRYGPQGTLIFEAPEQGGVRASIEFPYEP